MRAAAEKYGYPLTLWSYDEGLRNKLNSVLYVATPTHSQVRRCQLSGHPLRMKSVCLCDGDVSVEKSFTFDRDSYVVGVKTAVYVKGGRSRRFRCGRRGLARI